MAAPPKTCEVRWTSVFCRSDALLNPREKGLLIPFWIRERSSDLVAKGNL